MPWWPSAIRRLLLLGLLSATTTSCGGSGGTSTHPPTPSTSSSVSAQTKTEFIAKADTVCKTAGAQLKTQQAVINSKLSAEQANDTATNRQALGDAVGQDAALAGPLLDRLRVLEPPPGDRVVVAKYLAGVASQITLIKEFVTAIENDDAPAIQTISQQTRQGAASVQGLAQGYGFKVCGSGS